MRDENYEEDEPQPYKFTGNKFYDWDYKWIWGPHWIEQEKSDRKTYPVAFAIMDVVWPCTWIAAGLILVWRFFLA